MRRLRLMAVGGMLAAALGASSAGAGDGLEDGQVHGGYSAKAGEVRLLSVQAPAGLDRMMIETSGGTGNLDMFLRHGQPPDPKNHEYRSTVPDNNERIAVARPREGVWFIALYARAAFTDASIRVTFTGTPVAAAPPVAAPVPQVPPAPAPAAKVPPVPAAPAAPAAGPGVAIPNLLPGQPARGLTGGPNEGVTFRLGVPPGTTLVRFALEAGQGDCDLFIHHGSPPTPQRFTDRVTRAGAAPAVSEILDPAPGFWFIRVQGRTAFKDVALVVSYQPAQPPLEGPPTIVMPPPGPAAPVAPAAPSAPSAPAGRVRVPPVPAGVTPAAPAAPAAPGAPAADVAPVGAALPADVREPDDKRELARPLAVNDVQTRTIFPPKDQDWLVVQGVAPGRYVVEIFEVGVPLDGEVWIIGPDGKEKKVQTFKAAMQALTAVNLVVGGEAAGYKIRLAAQDSKATGGYKARLVAVAP